MERSLFRKTAGYVATFIIELLAVFPASVTAGERVRISVDSCTALAGREILESVKVIPVKN